MKYDAGVNDKRANKKARSKMLVIQKDSKGNKIPWDGKWIGLFGALSFWLNNSAVRDPGRSNCSNIIGQCQQCIYSTNIPPGTIA